MWTVARHRALEIPAGKIVSQVSPRRELSESLTSDRVRRVT
jgi:hypothetical protein